MSVFSYFVVGVVVNCECMLWLCYVICVVACDCLCLLFFHDNKQVTPHHTSAAIYFVSFDLNLCMWLRFAMSGVVICFCDLNLFSFICSIFSSFLSIFFYCLQIKSATVVISGMCFV